MDLSPQRPSPSQPDPSSQGLPWWLRPEALRDSLAALGPASGPRLAFQFGGGTLLLRSSDPELADRFAELYDECATDPAAADPARTVECRVAGAPDLPAVLVSFKDPEPLNTTGLYQLLFEEWGYVMKGAGTPGWWQLSFHLEPDLPLGAGSRADFLFDRGHRWQPLAGQLALNRVILIQKRHIFLHAASVSIGCRGAVLAGGKGQGKTTLALALAARGHGFLGDEVAAVSTRSWEITPFRRSASVRRGPGSRAVTERIREAGLTEERHPDGSWRTRVRVGRVFPEAAGQAAPLKALFVLLAREERPRVERIAPRREHLVRLPLLRCSLWEMPVARRFLALTRTLASAALFHLHPGDPDETADLIEATMESL